VSAAYGRTVTADNVRSLVDSQLRPMGLLTKEDGSQPEVKKSNPLLALRFKYAVSDPERTRRLTSPFARLFNPVLVVAVLAAFLAVCWWVLMEKGLASATYEAFDKPGLLLLVVAVTVLSAGFHEFGHAAAARRGGATPGVMGAGVYLVWPAFYTDVTDSYRLGRGGRVRTDLGGLYFNAIVAVGIAGIWWATRYDALLLVVATQILQMVRQLTPLVRFDGYHVLADLTGVPDLFQRIKPTLLGLLPWRWRHPETTVLKPWARAVVTLWVLVVVPVLAFCLFSMVIALPRLLGTAWASAGKQSTLMGQAWSDVDVLGVAARGIAVVAVTFPILAIGVILFRLIRSVSRSVWKRTAHHPVRRGVAGLVGAALVAGLAWVWWPHPGTYRPIQPFEGGTLVQAGTALTTAGRPAPSGLVEGEYGRLVTAWADGDARPTPQDPQLALVLIPRDPGTGSSADGDQGVDGSDSAGGAEGDAQPWVFPFNKPLQPGEDDNQALAVNTRDNSIRYDVAFALIWVEDDSPALNKNEAYAFASCTNCAAVAIGFQIVLVTGDNHVAVPQNISAAVNYDCVNCLTYALATQLFVTLDGPLSDAGMQEIAALWQEIAEFGAGITSVPLAEIRDRLTEYEQQILQVIEEEQGPLSPTDPGATPTDGSTGGADSTGGAAPTDGAGPTDGSSPDSGDTSGSTQDGDTGTTDDGSSGSTSDSPGGTSTGGGTSGSTGGSSGSTEPSPQSQPTPSSPGTDSTSTP
jgi:putative peptide zinc metalloprotease protein